MLTGQRHRQHIRQGHEAHHAGVARTRIAALATEYKGASASSLEARATSDDAPPLATALRCKQAHIGACMRAALDGADPMPMHRGDYASVLLKADAGDASPQVEPRGDDARGAKRTSNSGGTARRVL